MYEVGQFSSCYDGAQDWEYCLRLFHEFKAKINTIIFRKSSIIGEYTNCPPILWVMRKQKVKNQSIKLLNNYLSQNFSYGYAGSGPGNFYR